MGYNTEAIVVIVTHTVFVSLATAAVSLRFLAVRIRSHKPGPSDWMCLLSLAATVAWSACAYYLISLDVFGHDTNSLPRYQLSQALLIFFANNYTWILAISSFRISMLLFYLDIVHIRLFRLLVRITIGVVVAFFFTICIYALLRCNPVQAAWSLGYAPDSCHPLIPIDTAAASLNILLDLWIVFLPAPVIVRLKISRTKKAGILTTFGLGIIIAGIDAARLHDAFACEDYFKCICTDIYLIGEMSLGIVVTCAPVLGPVFLRTRSRRRRGKVETVSPVEQYNIALPSVGNSINFASMLHPESTNYTYSVTTSGQGSDRLRKPSTSDHITMVKDIEVTVEHNVSD